VGTDPWRRLGFVPRGVLRGAKGSPKEFAGKRLIILPEGFGNSGGDANAEGNIGYVFDRLRGLIENLQGLVLLALNGFRFVLTCFLLRCGWFLLLILSACNRQVRSGYKRKQEKPKKWAFYTWVTADSIHTRPPVCLI
jgi:hypothetical protein